MKETNWKELGKGLLLIIGYFIIIPDIFAFICHICSIPLDNKRNYLIVNGFIYGCMLLVLIYTYQKSLKKEGKDFLKNPWKYIKITFKNWGKAFLFMIITNSILIGLLGNIAENEAANRSVIEVFPIFSIISMAFIGPFIEEMLFRKGFKKAFKKEKHFLIFTSLLFGFGHILISLDFSSLTNFINCLPNLLFLIPYSGMGYFFGKAYYETDNVFTSTTAHMFHNTFAVVISLISSVIGV